MSINQKTPSPSPVSGVSSSGAVSLIQVQSEESGAVGTVVQKSLVALAKAETNVLFLSQTSNGHALSVAVSPDGTAALRRSLAEEFSREVQSGRVSIVSSAPEFAVLSVTGSQMRHRPGTAGRVFQTLGHNGVNIVAIAQDSSERDISFVVALGDREKALQALEEAFSLTPRTNVHLFLCGVGQVGAKFLEQLELQRPRLLERNKELRLCGISNSRQMLFDPNGIPIPEWKSRIRDRGEKSTAGSFVEKVKQLNLPNSIFIDCTASHEVPKLYKSILSSSISVVTPNKHGNSGSYQQYLELQETARRGNVKFFYETNVGAGLPIIGTLHDLLVSGDEVVRIEAVLSGTLSYIFNTFKNPMRFSDVVKDAKAKGYTEPDPREDLSGRDFGRKLLILAREMGVPMDESSLEIHSLVPDDCAKAGSGDEFFQKLSGHDESFANLLAQADAQSSVLRFLGLVENGKAKVSLEMVPATHPFYSLSGSDNIVSFTTKRYFDRPLVVKGPGAGIEVTAAGVLADVVRAVSYLQ